VAAPTSHRRYTLEEYVRLEEYANVRHEFLAGQIYARAGGTPEHGTYAANLIGLLTTHLANRPCRVQTSDVRIRVQATGLDTYPDASVIGGGEERDAGDPNAIQPCARARPGPLCHIDSQFVNELTREENMPSRALPRRAGISRRSELGLNLRQGQRTQPGANGWCRARAG